MSGSEKLHNSTGSYENTTFDDTVQRAKNSFDRRCPYGPSPYGIYPPQDKTTSLGHRTMQKIVKELDIGNVTYGDVDNESKSCSTCSKKEAKLQRCSRCKTIYYCNVECQKKDWETHKNVCVAPPL